MQKQMRLMKENASLNQNPDGFKQIPRTSNPQVIENVSKSFSTEIHSVYYREKYIF